MKDALPDRRGQLGDEHVLGQPALVARLHRGDAQRVALLAEQRVAAVARAVGPDRALLREVHDVLGRVARPRDVGLARLERRADRVQAGHERRVVAEAGQRLRAGAGHDVHRGDDVGRVGDLDAELRHLGGERAHAVGDDVHRAAAHRPAVEVGHQDLHLVRGHPVVGDAGVALVHRADVGAVLDPGDVGRVGDGVERVRLLAGFSRVNVPARPAVGDPGPLLGRAVDPHDPVGLGQLSGLANPGEQPRVRRRAPESRPEMRACS